MWFDHLYESNHERVITWGGVAYKITSVGSVFVHTLREVRYMPHMDRILIFVRELERTSFTGTLGDGGVQNVEGST